MISCRRSDESGVHGFDLQSVPFLGFQIMFVFFMYFKCSASYKNPHDKQSQERKTIKREFEAKLRKKNYKREFERERADAMYEFPPIQFHTPPYTSLIFLFMFFIKINKLHILMKIKLKKFKNRIRGKTKQKSLSMIKNSLDFMASLTSYLSE